MDSSLLPPATSPARYVPVEVGRFLERDVRDELPFLCVRFQRLNLQRKINGERGIRHARGAWADPDERIRIALPATVRVARLQVDVWRSVNGRKDALPVIEPEVAGPL